MTVLTILGLGIVLIPLALFVRYLTAPEYKPEDTRHLESPPPKPPKCPELPELKNVTLKDGTVADVRIVQFNSDAKLYVPASWFGGVDKEFRPGGFLDKMHLQNFAPDIHSVECPGVIHQFVPEKRNSDRIRPEVGVQIREDLDRTKNISLDSEIISFGITAGPTDEQKERIRSFNIGDRPPSAELSIIANGGSYDALVYLPDNLLAFLRTKADYNRKTVKSASLVEYVEWLKTPPAKRDNDRIFTLKVDSE